MPVEQLTGGKISRFGHGRAAQRFRCMLTHRDERHTGSAAIIGRFNSASFADL
jgi:hypothetical protein